MLRIDPESKTLAPLAPSERHSGTEALDFRRLLFSNPAAFFREMGQELFVVAKDLVLPTPSMLRLDMLALEKNGTAVVIVCQAGGEAALGRALACLALTVNWRLPDFLSRLTEDEARSLGSFLEAAVWGARSGINLRQRLLLIAEAFDYEMLAAVRVLRERYRVDIQCVCLRTVSDPRGVAEYLVCVPLKPRSALPAASRVLG